MKYLDYLTQTINSSWLNRNLQVSLENYKKQQEKIAKSKNCYEELMKAKTLTEAKIVLYGKKTKNCSAYKGHPDLANSPKRRK